MAADRWSIIARNKKKKNIIIICAIDCGFFFCNIPINERRKLMDVIPRITGISSNTQKAIAKECATYNLNIRKRLLKTN